MWGRLRWASTIWFVAGDGLRTVVVGIAELIGQSLQRRGGFGRFAPAFGGDLVHRFVAT